MAHFVIGDLHGYLSDFRRLLVENQLCDERDQWIGGQHNLWMIGDFFDRGDEGVACVDLIMDGTRRVQIWPSARVYGPVIFAALATLGRCD
jgi:hypothetical protein